MKAKCRGAKMMTFESMHRILGLPEDVEVTNIIVKPEREAIQIVLSSDKPIEDLTFDTAEGQSPIVTEFIDSRKYEDWEYQVYKKVLNSLIGAVDCEEDCDCRGGHEHE